MSPEVLAGALASYRASLQDDRRVLLDRYQVVDAARKVVGVGSVGLGAIVVLLEGGSDDDPLFLQTKEAEASVFERFTSASPFASHGERVVAGQRLLQAASDVLLGAGVGLLGRHGYMRQLQDQKGSAVIEVMAHDDLVTWGRLCGWALARGHARSGDPRCSRATWVMTMPWTTPWPTSPRATRTRTSATTRPSSPPSTQGRVEAETGV